jgi:hypothetical protein
MMNIKRFLFPLAAALMLACGFALASVEPADGLAYGYDQCMTDQGCDAVVSTQVVGPVMQLPGPSDYRSPVMRSDMRVASAGLVFKSALGVVERESTAPS